MNANWNEVRDRAAQPGSTVLARWNAERQAMKAGQISNTANGATFMQSSDPRVVEFLGGVPAAAGVYVTPESAQRVSAVFSCVDRIAGGVSTLPVKLYKHDGSGRSEIEKDFVVDLMNKRPCAAWLAASHWRRIMEYILLRGDAYTLIKRNRMGDIKELVPLPWYSVVVLRESLAVDSRNIYSVNDGLSIKGYDQDDILHFPGYGFDGMHSCSVLSWGARNAAGNAMAMDEYSGRFFEGGAHPSIVLKTDKKMDQKQIDLLQATFANKYSGTGNSHKRPLVLTEGMGVDNVSLSAADSQLLDARKFQVVEIARAFGVPPHLIGETSASTSWGSGIESMGRAFVMFTLNPHLTRIEQELNSKLFPSGEFFLEFDRDVLMEGDLKTQAEFYSGALGGPGTGPGYMTQNEIRKRRNLLPLPGGDELFNPQPKANGNKQGQDT